MSNVPDMYLIDRGRSEPAGTTWALPENLHGIIAHSHWTDWRDAMVAMRANLGPIMLLTTSRILGAHVASLADIDLGDCVVPGRTSKEIHEWVPGGREEQVRGRLPWQTDLLNWRLAAGVIVIDEPSRLQRLLGYVLRSAQDNPATAYAVATVLIDYDVAMFDEQAVTDLIRVGRKHNCTVVIMGDQEAQRWSRFVGFSIEPGPQTGKDAAFRAGDDQSVFVPFPHELATQGRILVRGTRDQS